MPAFPYQIETEFPLFLAPMEDVSDPPFRTLCKKNGADVLTSEFVSSEGLIRQAIKSIKKLEFSQFERPFGIQIFGGDEEVLAHSAEIVAAAEPDFLDINFGCPVKKVVSKGAGAAVLKDLNLMIKLSSAVVKKVKIPVTVKTRLGWDEKSINIVEVAEKLQDCGIKLLAIHGRTRTQLYKGESDWNYIAKVKNNPKITIPIIGNGDINSPEKALEFRNKYGVDGLMIGRAAIGYPWIFNEIKHYFKTEKKLPPPSLRQRIDACQQHLMDSIQWKGEILGILEMRKHYNNYLKGLPNIKEFRSKIVISTKPEEILELLLKIEEAYHDIEIDINWHKDEIRQNQNIYSL